MDRMLYVAMAGAKAAMEPSSPLILMCPMREPVLPITTANSPS